MKNHMQEMKRESKMYVSADKTTNFYKMEPEKYKDMLMKNITKEYKKTGETTLKKVNKEDKKIAEKLELDDRIYSFSNVSPLSQLKTTKITLKTTQSVGLLILQKVSLEKLLKKF